VLVNGQPEPNVKVYVYEPGTTNEIPIYEDEGVTPITQPILTDSQGRYAFFVDIASYPEIRIYLEKDGVDFSEVNEDLDGVPVPGAGNTFLALIDTPSSYVGRGGHVVLVKTTEDGIETQPWPVTGAALNFFLSDDAADVESYYYMHPTETGGTSVELTSPSLTTGDDQLLWSFVTEAGQPGINQLALGVYTATLFLKKTGNKDVRLYWKLFKRDTGGTETEILQSAVSDYLTADNSQYLISGYLNEDQALDPTDRLVFKLYANVSGTGTDVTVTLTMEGDYDSRLTINVLSSAFNLDRLSDVTITSPGGGDILRYDGAKWANMPALTWRATPGGDGVTSIWRMDYAGFSGLPRTSTISSISEDVITLSADEAYKFFHANMEGVSYVRIWNTSKSPAQSAWVKATPAANQLQVTNSADISGWAAGETIQIGNPNSPIPTKLVAAIDISPMLQNTFGEVFPIKGIALKVTVAGNGTVPVRIGPTPDGSPGSFVWAYSLADGSPTNEVIIVPTTEPSPISDSTLLMICEDDQGDAFRYSFVWSQFVLV